MAGPYVTTWRRRLISIPVGALVGGALLLAATLLFPDARDFLQRDEEPAKTLLAIFSAFGCAWLFAITAAALPYWLWAGRRRAVEWSDALIWGVVPGTVVALIIFGTGWFLSSSMGGRPMLDHWQASLRELARLGFACSIIGCVVGLAMWRVAYRRVPPPQIADAFS